MKLEEKFVQLRAKGELGIIAYFTAGYPTLEKSIDIFHSLERSGADILEVGIPFSDPLADGPTIQYSSEVALRNGTTLRKILKEFSKRRFSVPLVVMSYLNPILAYGEERFFQDLKEAGFSGLIIPDLPPDEADPFLNVSLQEEIDLIFLIAPNTPLKRAISIADKTRGFLYCVTVLGTTGAREELPDYTLSFIKQIRSSINLPLAVGFGLSNSTQIKKFTGLADAVVIGSKLIDLCRKGEEPGSFIREIKGVLKNEISLSQS